MNTKYFLLRFTTLLFISLCVLTASHLTSADWPDWFKKLGQQRGKRMMHRHTSVAAIRGLNEPSQIDPDARNYEAVVEMETYGIDSNKLTDFENQAELQRSTITLTAEDQSILNNPISEVLKQNSLSKEMAQAVKPISLEEEINIGRQVAANVIAQFGIINNKNITEYVNYVGNTVALSSPRKEIKYYFAVLDTPMLNAFAAPGGYIFISKGLLMLLKDEAQLACVLGHEIAHVTEKHVIKEIQKSNIVQASIPSYVKASAKQSVWMNQVSELSIQMLWKGLSRDDEMHSDRLGLIFAAQSGYDAQAGREVLEVLNEKTQATDPENIKQVKFLLSTHPNPKDRLQAIEPTLKNLPTTNKRLAKRFEQFTLAQSE